MSIKSFVLLFALSLAVANADPQFGGFGGGGGGGLGALNPAKLASDAIEYGTKIKDLVEVVGLTLTEMGNIAVADNNEVGTRIVNILQGEILRANKVLADWTAKAGRFKRDVSNSGKDAHNEVGGILVGSNDKIATDKGELSPNAQDDIDAAHAKGVAKCDADPCKNHKAIKNKTKGAQRQG